MKKEYKYNLKQLKSLIEIRKTAAGTTAGKAAIEKTAAGDQIYFGKITALQPKAAPRKDKHTAGTPLFEQGTPEDKNQLNIFDNNSSKEPNK